MKPIKISWFKYLKDAYKLEKIISKEQIKYDFILGVSRGGNILATILSYRLGVPLGIISVESYVNEFQGEVKIDKGISNFGKFKNCKKILLVDDLLDSGETINNLLMHIKGKDIDVAVLYNKNNDIKPKYCVQIKKRWIEFPYER